MAFETWTAYFYPAPDAAAMRNLFDERSPARLHTTELLLVAARHRQLASGAVPLSKTFDADHVRAIHKHLFQDVYAWAGQYRSVNMSKGAGRTFGDVHTGEIDRLLDDVHSRATYTGWAGLDRGEFGRRSAEVFAYLNQAHPFREGNGRTSKIFMDHLAEQSRFSFDFSRVSPRAWNQASMMSGPDRGTYHPVPDSLFPVFQAMAVERLAPPSTSTLTAQSIAVHLGTYQP